MTIIQNNSDPAPYRDMTGRARVSVSKKLFDGVNHYGIDLDVFETLTQGSGSVTYNSVDNGVVLTAANSGDRAVLQSNGYIRYQPGKTQRINGTMNWKSPAGALYVVQRTRSSGSLVESKVINTSFNNDKLDGTGNSGFALNKQLCPLLMIDFLHLGVGPTRFFTVNENGELVVAHVFKNPNSNATMWAKYATLPFRVEIINNGSQILKRQGFFDDDEGVFWEVLETDLTKNNFTFYCGSVESENGDNINDERGIPRSASNEVTPRSVSSSFVSLVAIRPKTNFNSKAFRGVVVPTSAKATSTSRDVYCALLLNPSVTGGTWVSRDSKSAVEYNVSATSVSGGEVIEEFHVIDGFSADLAKDLLSKIALSTNLSATSSDVFVLAAKSTFGSADVFGTLGWKEIR